MADLSTSFNPAWIADTSDVASSAYDLAGTVSNVASAASSAIAARTDQSVKSAAAPEFTGLTIAGDPGAKIEIATTGSSNAWTDFNSERYTIQRVTTYNEGEGPSGELHLRKARGTIASPSAVEDSDTVGFLIFAAHDGTSFEDVAGIQCSIDGSVDTDETPGNLLFFTRPAGGGDFRQVGGFYSDGLFGAVYGFASINARKQIYFDECQTATGDGTTTIDWGEGNKFYFTFGAANEAFTFTAPSGPCNVVLVLKQDGVGSRTVTWPNTVMWPGGTAPALSTGAAAIDIVCFFYDGTNYFGQASLDFSVPA